MKLTVIIPCYNEESTIAQCIEAVLALRANLSDMEIVFVDDGSTDGSMDVAKSFKANAQNVHMEYIKKAQNEGKGAAVHDALEVAKGDVVVVQDADLEYNPQDLIKMFELITSDEADVVYGSRVLSGQRSAGYKLHSVVNHFMTLLVSLLTGHKFTDIHTCYIMMKKDLLKSLNLKERRFAIEPEIAVKLVKKSRKDTPLRLKEVPISYSPRTYKEGKKIRWQDGVRAVVCVFKYRFQ